MGRGLLWSLLGLLGLVVVVAFPAIDLAVAGLFHVPGEGFPARIHPFFEFMRKGVAPLLVGAGVYVLVLWLCGEMFGQWFLGIDRRLGAYLVLSLAVGPGLIVNSLFKEHWGRARPSQIVEYGGAAIFTPALLLTDQCPGNCSFASGHGALGFWPLAFALLAPPPWRTAALAAALAFGGMMGLTRIAQGGHFLSDVLFAAAITIGVTLLLHRWLIGPRPPAAAPER